MYVCNLYRSNNVTNAKGDWLGEKMKEYILSIMYIAIFALVLELIIPDGKLKKYVISIISLLAIITIISPLKNVLKAENVESTIKNVTETLSNNVNTKDIDISKYDFSKYSNTNITTSVKEKIEKSIIEELGTDEVGDVNVILDDEYIIEKVEIYMVKKNSELLGTAKVSKIIQKVSDKFNIEQSKIKIIER